MMTRKDYVKIADILNAYHLKIDPNLMSDLISDFQIFFKKDNPNFDSQRFLDAVCK